VEAGDQVLDMVPVTPGINNVSFDIPAGSLPYDGIYNWFSRFRLVRDLNIQGDCSDDAGLTVGGTFLNGEVEDHYLFMDRESPTGTGPGGVGTNDATSALALWLNASAISQTNGSLVTDWSDLSGFDYHAAGAGASAPTYQQSVINGQAVVRFDNVDDGMLISDTLSLDAPYAAFVVYNNTAAPASAHRALQGQDNNWFMGFDSSSLAHFAGGFVANTGPLNPSQFYIAGANNFNLFSFYRLDGVDQTDSAGFVGFPGRLSLGADGVTADPLGGDIAEVIVYHHGLNTARMFIVENYLSSKYEIVIPGAVDKYDGDTPAENHFDLDVAGIGQEADGLSSSAS
jgi:hypothetical protein